MNALAFTVHRPVFTVMATLVVVVLGLNALARLPIDLMPDITYPTLSVTTEYANASPQEVERLLTEPIEAAAAAITGVEQISSSSVEGTSQVRVSFTWGRDLDAAANDLRDRLDRLGDVLPEEATRPLLRKFDLADFPILIIGVAGPGDALALRRLVDEQVAPRFERLPGVAAVEVRGGLEREIQVRADPARLQALGLSLDAVSTAIREANLTLPAGTLPRGALDIGLRVPGEYRSLAELRQTEVARPGGAAVTLGQLAEVRDGHVELTRVVRLNGAPGVQLALRKQAGSNTVEVSAAARRELERMRSDFPQLELVPVVDTADYIERSIGQLGRALLYGGLLAAGVLLVFLRSLRATAVVMLAVPIAIVASFVLLYFAGYTLNLMTLGGLALGVGMMVDSAIVVLENIARLRDERALGPLEAAIAGTREVAPAVVASTLTTLAIFLPLLFLQGFSGAMFGQLAAVVAFSLGCALLVALTLVPMLAARLLAAPVDRPQPDDWLGRLSAGYGRLLGAALRRRGLTLLAAFALFALALAAVPRIGSEFMPATDEAEVRVSLEMEPGTRLEVLDARMQALEAQLAPLVPETAARVMRAGASSYRVGSAATGEVRLSLLPAGARDRSSAEVAAAVQAGLDPVPGARLRVREGQGLFLLRLGSGGGDERLQVEVRGPELEVLERLAEQAQRALEQVPGVTDVRASRERGVPQTLLHVDRQRAADLGVSVATVARTLETAVAGRRVSDFHEGGETFPIRLRLGNPDALDIDRVLDLRVPARDAPVPLRQLLTAQAGRGPVQIDRSDQQRLITLGATLAGRDLGAVAADLRRAFAAIAVPQGYRLQLAGDVQEQRQAFGQLGLSLALALALVYMVMAALYESLRDPLVVMCSVPLALIGVVALLLLTGSTWNVQSLIGLIMLGGIVVNNAILIVDRATSLRRDGGLAVAAALQEAGRQRLRPILMTSLTTILALAPLALGLGEGADIQAPMARAVIGGLMSATPVTLVVIPVVYALVRRARAPAPGVAV